MTNRKAAATLANANDREIDEFLREQAGDEIQKRAEQIASRQLRRENNRAVVDAMLPAAVDSVKEHMADAVVDEIDQWARRKYAAPVVDKFNNKSYESESFTSGILHYLADLEAEQREYDRIHPTERTFEDEDDLLAALARNELTGQQYRDHHRKLTSRSATEAQVDDLPEFASEEQAAAAWQEGRLTLEELRRAYREQSRAWRHL